MIFSQSNYNEIITIQMFAEYRLAEPLKQRGVTTRLAIHERDGLLVEPLKQGCYNWERNSYSGQWVG